MGDNIRHFRELDVYKLAMDAAMEIFAITVRFTIEEKYMISRPDQWTIKSIREEEANYA